VLGGHVGHRFIGAGDQVAQLDTAGVRGGGKRLAPTPGVLGDLAGQQVSLAGDLRVELPVERGADAEVQHLRDGRRLVQRPIHNRIGEHLGGVVPGEFRP